MPGTPTAHRHRGLSRRRVLALAPAVVAGVLVAVVVALLALVVRGTGSLPAADASAIRAATDVTRAHPGLRSALLLWQTVFAPVGVYVVATLVCLVVAWRSGRRSRSVWGFVTMMVAWNVALDLKLLVQRVRPVVEDPVSSAPGFSFPSGHVANVAAAVTTLVVVLWPGLRTPARRALAVAVAAVLVGLTALDRVFLGVHYPSDTVGAVLVGCGLVGASFLGYRGWTRHGNDPGNDPDDDPDDEQEPGMWRHRWDDVDHAPRPVPALRDLALRVLAPAVLLWLVVVGIGDLIEGPLGGFPAENAVNRAFADARTSLGNAVTAVWSHVGNTEIVIGVCVVVVALTWWRTRQWWYAVVPALAITVQATVFVLATAVVGRDRPDVSHLDPAPPTSSYPSGHVGASTALYLTLALMCHRIPSTPLRRVLTALCLLVPVLVLVARLYRGMHHLTDVLVGVVDGVVCAALAWGWLRVDDRDERVGQTRA